MKVSPVRTSNGDTVSLLFGHAGVRILSASARGNALLRAAGAAIFAAIGLAAAGLGIGHSVSVRFGQWLSIGAGLTTVAGVGLAAAAWVLVIRSQKAVHGGDSAPTVPVDMVAWARSSQQHGRVTVTLGMADGDTHEFSAVGMAGPELARQFALLLDVTCPPTTSHHGRPDGPTLP